MVFSPYVHVNDLETRFLYGTLLNTPVFSSIAFIMICEDVKLEGIFAGKIFSTG